MQTLTFKLSDNLVEQLEARAKQYNGISRHKLAREIVTSYLKDHHRQQLQEDLNNLRLEVKKLREDLATSVTAILVHAGKIKNQQEAQDWVMKNLL